MSHYNFATDYLTRRCVWVIALALVIIPERAVFTYCLHFLLFILNRLFVAFVCFGMALHLLLCFLVASFCLLH